jgi:hypothetical protein
MHSLIYSFTYSACLLDHEGDVTFGGVSLKPHQKTFHLNNSIYSYLSITLRQTWIFAMFLILIFIGMIDPKLGNTILEHIKPFIINTPTVKAGKESTRTPLQNHNIQQDEDKEDEDIQQQEQPELIHNSRSKDEIYKALKEEAANHRPVTRSQTAGRPTVHIQIEERKRRRPRRKPIEARVKVSGNYLDFVQFDSPSLLSGIQSSQSTAR